MKRKDGLIVLLLTVIAIAVIFFGMRHTKDQQDQLEKNSSLSATATTSEKKEEESLETTDEQIEKYEETLDSLSLVDYLNYLSLTKEKNPSLAFYGDVTEDSLWVTDIQGALNQTLGHEISYDYASYPEVDSYGLYIQQDGFELNEGNPDILVFRPNPLADQMRDSGLTETGEYTTNILRGLKDRYPDSRIYMLEAGPNPSLDQEENSRGLKTYEYMDKMNESAEEEDVRILSVYNEMSEAMEESSDELLSFYTEDEENLNETGQRLYAEIVLTQMEK